MDILNGEYWLIAELTERVKRLEDKTFKKSKKEETTRAQQMLILKHLGILETLEELKIIKKLKAELLAILLNTSAENIEHDLTTINSSESPLVTKKNYEFLVKTFTAARLERQKKETEYILESLLRKG